jgi:hypothetical protein
MAGLGVEDGDVEARGADDAGPSTGGTALPISIACHSSLRSRLGGTLRHLAVHHEPSRADDDLVAMVRQVLTGQSQAADIRRT